MDLKTASPIPRFSNARRLQAPWAVLILFTASGASSLMLEVVWSRMLGWLLGATTWSVMTVLVAFMGGLGIGAIIWGRTAARLERPLRFFGLLEIAIGLYSLAVPALFEGIGKLFVIGTHALGESPAMGIWLRVATAVVALGPPTLLMGGTLPVLTRFAAIGRNQPGRLAGLLYAVNTAGAVLGCVLAGCGLIFWLGVIETNFLAAAIDLVVGSLALLWDRREATVTATVHPVDAPTAERRAGSAALVIAMTSGFCGLAYELLWTRGLMAVVSDDTTYAFTLMLTAFLAGHAIGAASAGRKGKLDRPDQSWRRLGAAQMLAAVAALVSIPVLVTFRAPLNQASFHEGMSFWGARIPFHLGISLLVFAPSAFFLGASFTLAARLYVGRGRPVGTSTGRLYGLNTLASVVGSIVATVWLVPALGAQRSIVALALFQAGQGVLALLFGGIRDPADPDPESGARAVSYEGLPGRIYTAAILAIGVAFAFGLNEFLLLSHVYAMQEPGRLLTLLEGQGAAITVHQRTPSDRVISINGVNVAGTNSVLRATQKLQGHLPVCLHHAPRSVLQIGFGSGGTCYSVSLHPEVQSIEVVELNPDVLKIATDWFDDINHGVLSNPRVKTRIVDAKSHVAATQEKYDLILSDSTHPRFRGNAALYGADYFANCARRLNPGGIFTTWLPLYGMSVDDVRGILKSFHAVFPHVQVWYANSEPHENTIVLASLDPIAIDPGFLARRLAAPPVAADLAEVGITSTEQVLDYFMLGDRAVAEFSRTGQLNTDDHPRLEFMAPRSVRRKQSFVENFAALRLAREPIDPYLVNASPAKREELARWYAGTTWKLAGQSDELEGRAADALRDYEEGARLNPDDIIGRIRLDRFRRAFAATPGLAKPATEAR